MKPTRIAYLVSRYPAVSHTFILREVRQLRELGFDIVPMSVNSPDRALSDMNADEFEETRRTFYLKSAGLEAAAATLAWALTNRPVACLKGLMAAWRLRKSFGLVKSLAYGVESAMVVREMQRQGTEHLHVHFASAAASVALLAQQAFGIRLSMTVHGPDEFDDVLGQALPQKIAAADAIVCISDFARAQLMRLSEPRHWPKLSVARLGVDLARHGPAVSLAAASETTTKTALHLLCVGRLTPAKGQRLLLQAFADLPADLAEARMTVVGAGPDDAALKALARELGIAQRVTFTGAQSEAQVLAHMQSADLFCLPSFAEGIPVVLMEAMACAVPCLSTTACGIPELVGHGEHGLLVRPGDVFGLTVAMVSLLRDGPMRQRMGRAGRAQVRALYDLQQNIHDLADTLLHMTQGQRSRQVPTCAPALTLDRI
jgi:colanic acid/amylovoran biosynthesis glycosyltransferase